MFFLLLLGSTQTPSPAFAQFRDLCRDGSTPRFTGHPFLPSECPETPPAPENSAEPAPPASGDKTAVKEAQSPEGLLGRWEGVSHYGNARHLVVVELRRGKHGRLEGKLQLEDYRLHFKHALRAALDPKVRSGRYAAKVWLELLPENSLKAEARFELAPRPLAGEENFTRAVTVIYRGQEHPHQVLLSPLGKDKLRYEYRDFARANITASGELRRANGP